jgi:hypothetical protein
VAIIGSTVDEVGEVLDAPDEGSVAGTDAYVAAADHLVEDPALILYVNVQGILDEVRDFMDGDTQAFDQDVAPLLRQVRAVVFSTGGSGDTAVGRLFVVVADPEE